MTTRTEKFARDNSLFYVEYINDNITFVEWLKDEHRILYYYDNEQWKIEYAIGSDFISSKQNVTAQGIVDIMSFSMSIQEFAQQYGL